MLLCVCWKCEQTTDGEVNPNESFYIELHFPLCESQEFTKLQTILTVLAFQGTETLRVHNLQQRRGVH